jgi:hypothetical protein
VSVTATVDQPIALTARKDGAAAVAPDRERAEFGADCAPPPAPTGREGRRAGDAPGEAVGVKRFAAGLSDETAGAAAAATAGAGAGGILATKWVECLSHSDTALDGGGH